MELDEFHVGDARARPVRERDPVAGRHGRIGRLPEHLAGAPGRQQRAPGPGLLTPPSGPANRTPRTAPGLHDERRRPRVDVNADVGHRTDPRPEHAPDLASRRVPRMQDAPDAVRGLEPQRRRPSGARSNAAPHAISSRTYRAPSSTSTAAARSSQRPSPAASVSAAWRAGLSSGPTAAAMPPCAKPVLLCFRSRLGEHQHLTRVRERDGGAQSGDAAADYQEIGLQIFVIVSLAVHHDTYRVGPCRRLPSHRRRLLDAGRRAVPAIHRLQPARLALARPPSARDYAGRADPDPRRRAVQDPADGRTHLRCA